MDLWSIFSKLHDLLFDLTFFKCRANQLNFWDFAERVTVPGVGLQRAPHVVLETLLLYLLPEVSKRISRPLGQQVALFNIKPESCRFRLGLVFLLQSNLEDLDCLRDGVSDMLLGAESEPFAAINVVVIREEVLFRKKLSFFDTLNDPFCFVNVTIEEVLLGQGVGKQLKLVSKTLVELRNHAAIFLNQSLKFSFLVVRAPFNWVGDVKD